MKPDRVVIGAEDPRAAELMKELYAPFTRTGAPIMMMDCASAELCKYAANAMLATRISFMNEVANVCEAVGADVDQVRRAVGVGPPHRPVVPVSRASATAAAASRRTSRRCCGSPTDEDYDFQILKAVEDVNERQKMRLVDKMQKHFGSLKGKTHRASGAWRSSRAPTTCARRRRCRSSRRCSAAGATVQAYDPEAMKVAQAASSASKVTLRRQRATTR